MTDVQEIGFELERFGWTAPGRLEVVGRWSGLSGRRLGRPVLTLEVAGHRRRFTALPGGHLAPTESEQWRAAFAFEGEPEDVTSAELEIGRRLVVDLPRPRRRRRRGATDDVQREIADLRAQVAALQSGRASGADAAAAETDDERDAELARLREEADEERGLREAAEAALAERWAELESLRGEDEERERRGAAERELAEEVERLGHELATLREAHATLQTEHTHLLGEFTEARESREHLTTELAQARDALKASETERERLASEIAQLRADVTARDEELAAARGEVEQTHAEAERRLAEERAASTEVHEKLATAREEAQRAIAAEAADTERMRAELRTAREETERLLGAERAETARLREELAARPAPDDDEGEDADGTARRMYERIASELERERAATRSLRRELDTAQAQTAEHRRAASAAAANGVTTTEEGPLAATPAGRLAAARRTEVGRAAAHHRAEAARAAAAQRVPEGHPTSIGVWAVRIAAIALVAGLLVALIIIVSAVA